MIITLRMSELDGTLVKKYAKFNDETVSAFIRRVAMEEIEREYKLIYKRSEAYSKMVESWK